MLSAAAMVLASGAAFVWLQPRQAHAPGAIVPPRVAVEQVAPAPAQPARPPPAPQPAALVPEPVAVTPDPAVTALMQRAFDMEEHDPAGAAVAYARAALRGSPRAAYYLGQFHETGAGVEPSSGLAGLWYAAAGDLPAAQQRLQALSGAVAQTGTPSAPLPIFQARLRSGGSEMIWSLRDGVTPVRFRVESFGPADEPLPVTETAVPGLILPFPVSAWRVIAIGSDDTESAPSATVRMIPAGE